MNKLVNHPKIFEMWCGDFVCFATYSLEDEYLTEHIEVLRRNKIQFYLEW